MRAKDIPLEADASA